MASPVRSPSQNDKRGREAGKTRQGRGTVPQSQTKLICPRQHPARHKWPCVSFGITPSINTDFENSISSEAFQLDGRGMFIFQLDQYWSMVLGAGYWDRVKDRVIPYAGLTYRDDFWEWQLMFPKTTVSVFLGNETLWSKWLYLTAEYHVEAYEVNTAPGPPRGMKLNWRTTGSCWVSGWMQRCIHGSSKVAGSLTVTSDMALAESSHPKPVSLPEWAGSTRRCFKIPVARHSEIRSVSEGLQSKRFQRHPSITRWVSMVFEAACQLRRPRRK